MIHERQSKSRKNQYAGRILSAVVALQEKSEDGPFVFGSDPPPKGTEVVLYWDKWSHSWQSIRVRQMNNGTIWRYCLSEPTELLE